MLVGCVAIDGGAVFEGAGVLTEVEPPPQLIRVALKDTDTMRGAIALTRLLQARTACCRLDSQPSNFATAIDVSGFAIP